MIRHIVVWKLLARDEPTKNADIAVITAALSALPALIPGVKALTVGPNIVFHPSNWDIGLVVDYATVEDLEAYRVHPEHRRVVAIVNPRVSQRASLDFEF